MTTDGTSLSPWAEEFTGMVALISGAARGQGRSHALALAAAGADLALIDGPEPLAWLPYEPARRGDLERTVEEAEALGRRAVWVWGDIRNRSALDDLVASAMTRFDRIDYVIANAGVVHAAKPFWEIPHDEWRDVIDVNLTGTWNTVSAAVPSMIAGGRGGAVVITSSAAALRGASGIAAYVAGKSALHGLLGSMARELAAHQIRVNAVAPTTVDTPMVMQESYLRGFRPDLDAPQPADVAHLFQRMHLLAEPWLHASDVTNTVLFLLSQLARPLTGHVIPVDFGAVLR